MKTISLRLLYFGIAFLACGPFLVTPLLAQDYPLATGTRWTYNLKREGERGPNLTTLVAHVAGTDQIGGKTYTRVESYSAGKLANVDWFALTPDGLMHAKSEDGTGGGQTELNPPERMLSPTLAPLEAWTWQDSQSPKSSRTTVLAPEQIRVPAGTYRAIPVRTETSIPTHGEPYPYRETLTQWFVPGIGYVKYELRIESGGLLQIHNTAMLEKFEHAPVP